MLTPEQATILRVMTHLSLSDTLYRADLDNPVVRGLVAATYGALVDDDFDEWVYGNSGNAWLLITAAGREALAAYDAAHITVPRAAVARLYDFCAELTCPDPVAAELDELEPYIAPK